MSNGPVTCRSCGSRELSPIISMGRTPLANALLTREQLHSPEPTYPLDLVFCPGCALVQITETVPPEELFRDYVYRSSFSDTAVAEAGALAGRMIDRRGLGPNSLVIEPASNDGYLLQHYRRRGVPVLGIEPARNIAEIAQNQNGVPTLCDFFGAPLARRLADEGRRADVLHANNVLAHVADLNGFVAGIATVLKDGGVAVIEAPYVRDMIERVEFDTIYHEHLCYFSLTALRRLFSTHGLTIADVERIPIHGGSLRIFAEHARGATAGDTVRRLSDEELKLGMDRVGYYADFAARVEKLRRQLRKTLADLKAAGHSIAAYGASAKGSTLLNYFGIGGETLDFVVDRSTLKQGRFTPGTHLPILATAALLERKPDYVLVLTWNFLDEIVAQQAEYRARGGRFIVPIPEPRIV